LGNYAPETNAFFRKENGKTIFVIGNFGLSCPYPQNTQSSRYIQPTASSTLDIGVKML